MQNIRRKKKWTVIRHYNQKTTVAKPSMKMAADLVWQGLQPNKKRQFIAAFLL